MKHMFYNVLIGTREKMTGGNEMDGGTDRYKELTSAILHTAQSFSEGEQAELIAFASSLPSVLPAPAEAPNHPHQASPLSHAI